MSSQPTTFPIPSRTSVGRILEFYASSKPSDARTITSITKRVLPSAADLSGQELVDFLFTVPVDELAATLAPDSARWASHVQARFDARGWTDDTNSKAYPRAIARLLKFCAAAGLLEDREVLTPPDWQVVLDAMDVFLPSNKAELVRWRDAGVKEVLGHYDIQTAAADRVMAKIHNMRTGVRTLIKSAIALGLDRHMFCEVVLQGDRFDEIDGMCAKGTHYSYARNFWNHLAAKRPTLGLAPWPRDRRRTIAPAPGQVPGNLRIGVEKGLFEGSTRLSFRRGLNKADRKASTNKNYMLTIEGFFGILLRNGVDLAAAVDGLEPRDAIGLIFGGCPPELLTETPELDEAEVLVRRLVEDRAFRDRYRALQRRLEGTMDGLPAVESPFCSVYLRSRYQGKEYCAADNLVDRLRTLNESYLGVRGAHLDWIDGRRKELVDLQKRNPTRYDHKKDLVFQFPNLRNDLLARVDFLIDGLERHRSPGSSQWAVEVRFVVFFYLILLHPMRIMHFSGMRLGHHFDASNYRINFEASETKNDTPIDIELPGTGRHARLRDLVDLYLNEARPKLLLGAESPFFFVPNRQTPNAGLGVRQKFFNALLEEASQGVLRPALPPGLARLNPHLLRHIVATHEIVNNHSAENAAMLLNDPEETVRKHYSNLIRASRRYLKGHYEAET